MDYVYAVLAIVLALAILKLVLKLTIKIFMSIFITLAILLTVAVVVVQPKMHKEFNFNIIEKILKINSDGTTSIIEKTTTTKRE